jgi:DNA adenine methylase
MVVPQNIAEHRTLKPPLKWAGGKRWLVPELMRLWQPYQERRYVEPFCGGLAGALGLLPSKALLNDVNPHLINFYIQLKHGLELDIEAQNEEQLFYRHRDRFNELIKDNRIETSEAAQLFYYLNRTCFNGLCRFNQRGEFNVPFGTYSNITYATDFYEYIPRFREWTFTSCDVASIRLRTGDFVYADPPYDVDFTTYSAGGFSWKDQVRTAERLSKHNGPTVISNQATDRIIRLYQELGFTLTYFDAPRRISCTGNRSTAREVLATKGL